MSHQADHAPPGEGRERILVWKMMLGVALVAMATGFCIVPLDRVAEHRSLQTELDSTIRYLKPSGPTPHGWECASNWTVTACCNVCITGYTTAAEMHRLRDDLEEKLKGQIDL